MKELDPTTTKQSSNSNKNIKKQDNLDIKSNQHNQHNQQVINKILEENITMGESDKFERTLLKLKFERTLLKLLSDQNTEAACELIQNPEKYHFGPHTISLLNQENEMMRNTKNRRNHKDIVNEKHNSSYSPSYPVINAIIENAYQNPNIRTSAQKIAKLKSQNDSSQQSNSMQNIRAELERILNEIKYSIYKQDLGYISYLLALLPPELKSSLNIAIFTDRIMKEENENANKNYVMHSDFDIDQTIDIANSVNIFAPLIDLLKREVKTPQDAEQLISSVMEAMSHSNNGELDRLIKSSPSYEDKLRAAIKLTHFKDMFQKYGDDMLHRACESGSVEIVRIVLEMKDDGLEIDFKAQNNRDLTPEECARMCKDELVQSNILKMLEDSKNGIKIKNQEMTVVKQIVRIG